MTDFRIGYAFIVIATATFLPRDAQAQCIELQSLAGERAEALHLARQNIRELTRLIADTDDGAVKEELESDRLLLREQHAAIVKKIEANGQRLIEDCSDDG